jgi:hypothetical protein
MTLPAAAHAAAVSITPARASPDTLVAVRVGGLPPGAAGHAELRGAPSAPLRASARGVAVVELRLRRTARPGCCSSR